MPSPLAHVSRDMKILVVDDVSTMRRIVKSILSQLGFTKIEEAEDGKEALARVEAGGVEFVISDWKMPNMMGLDLLKALRAKESTKALPFLMVTAESQKENLSEATKVRGSSYIVKPFTPETLEAKLGAIFAK